MPRDGQDIASAPLRGRFAAIVTLATATGGDVILCVRCPCCDVLARFDAEAWLARRLGLLRLGRLQPKLRCLACGARQADFELWNATALPPGLRRWSAAQLAG